jgi:hypothetical protein
MHSVTVFMNNGAWALLFKEQEKALSAVEQLRGFTGVLLEIPDDFGQVLSIRKDLAGWMHEDMELSKHARVEMMLHQARTQALGQRAAQSDSIIRTHQRMQGPAILDPIPR